MIINRIWSMPNRWTFTINPIKKLLEKYVHGYSGDAFSGKNSPAVVKNDLIEKADFNLDALEFMKLQPSNVFDCFLNGSYQ